jgi:hypothetical protein
MNAPLALSAETEIALRNDYQPIRGGAVSRLGLRWGQLDESLKFPRNGRDRPSLGDNIAPMSLGHYRLA